MMRWIQRKAKAERSQNWWLLSTSEIKRTFRNSRDQASLIGKQAFEEKQEGRRGLERYVCIFNERHDNMTIYNAIVHLDETGTPPRPFAHSNVTGYKSGLAVQPSFQALEQKDSVRSGREQLKAFPECEIKPYPSVVHENWNR